MKNFPIILVFGLLFIPSLALSATTAVVEIDTGTETINALEGNIELPVEMRMEDIYIGNSAILMWITEPVFNRERRTITFAGVTPGGFRGKYPLFFITGEFRASDLIRASFSQISALKDDGAGTEAPVKLALRLSEITKDIIPPEPFTPLLSSSPDIFDNRYFLSFVTQDKGTGVVGYEYSSSWFIKPAGDSWVSANSPLVLSRQELFKRIYIRAADKVGNEREVSTAGPYRYATVSISTIILVCILLYLGRQLSRYYSYSS